jgi:hypothetical protein
MTYQRPGARLVANGATTVFTQPSREEVAIVSLPLDSYRLAIREARCLTKLLVVGPTPPTRRRTQS